MNLTRALLENVAASSDDPDTKIACIITLPGGGGFISSANSLPREVEVEADCLERPRKYSYVQHAERRAIDIAAFSGMKLSGSTLFCNWFPCAACAGSIVTSGIKLVVADREKYEARKEDPRYGFAEAADILRRGKVEVRWLD